MHGAPRSITDVSFDWPSLERIVQTLTLQAGYNTTLVLIGTTLLGVAAGTVGAFALLRKRSLMGDALSHASLPGIAGAFIFAAAFGLAGKSLLVLLTGAAITGVLAVVTVQLMVRHTRLTEDAAIGVVLSVFFGAGVVLLSYIQNMSTGDQAGIATFIYGQTAAMNARDAMLMGAVAIAAVAGAALLLKEFALVCFDEDFAAVQGWPVSFIDLLMMALIVLVIVVGLQAVGLILVVAMLIIPAAAARFWTDKLGRMTTVAACIGGVSGYLGAGASALFPRLPTGSVIVLIAGLLFVISMALAPKRGVAANVIRAIRVKLKVASDHMLVDTLQLESKGVDDSTVSARGRMQERAWSRPNASVIRTWLAWRGLLKRTAGSMALTPAGETRARQILRTRRLWELYLVTFADVAPSHVDWSADLVEHVLPRQLVDELEAALDGDTALKSAPA